MKYFRIGVKGHILSYFVYAPSAAEGLKLLDLMLGGTNPAALLVTELPACPKGYRRNGDAAQILDVADEDEE